MQKWTFKTKKWTFKIKKWILKVYFPKKAAIIEPVSGHGKGKYKFKKH